MRLRPCAVAALKAVEKDGEKDEGGESGEAAAGGSSEEEEHSEEVYLAAKAEVEATTRAAVEAVEKAGMCPFFFLFIFFLFSMHLRAQVLDPPVSV